MNTTQRLIHLNNIQRNWMALSSDDPKETQEQVFKGMQTMPKKHLIISRNGNAAPIWNGMPIWPTTRPLGEAIAYAKQHAFELDIAWHVDGSWVAMPTV